MKSIDFKVEGTGELEKALKDAARQFPYSAEKALQKETREIKKEITNTYINDILISRHSDKYGWRKRLKSKKKTQLEKSFSPGKVIFHGDKITSAVTSKAPHYHLVEEGHEPGGWYGRQLNAKRVEGKKIVAKIMSRRSENSQEMGERVLNEIFKRAGL